MSRLRAALRCVIAALLLLESAGVARALGHGSDVHCCCGDHTAARRCHCHDCPVLKRRSLVPETGDHLAVPGECDGAGSTDAALSVIAARVSPPALDVAPAFVRTPHAAPATAPAERLLESDRPPP